MLPSTEAFGLHTKRNLDLFTRYFTIKCKYCFPLVERMFVYKNLLQNLFCIYSVRRIQNRYTDQADKKREVGNGKKQGEAEKAKK